MVETCEPQAPVAVRRGDRLRAMRCGPLHGRAAIPPDKSMSHRALILGALARGETRISGLLESTDVLATARALRAFGIEVERDAPGEWRVRGGEWRAPAAPVDCGNSGTTARLLIGAAAGFPIRAAFTGDESLCSRPMERLTAPLSKMGARFDRMDRLPLTVTGGGLTGIEYVNLPASAQVKSAILLAGLMAEGDVVVAEPAPTRHHTEIMLGRFGCDVAVDGERVSLGERRRLAATSLEIPGDPSSAAFAWTAAAIVPGSRVETPGVLVNPLRTGFLEALRRMGATVEIANRRAVSGEQVADVAVAHAPLRPIALPAEAAPTLIDELPLLAIAAAFAPGASRIDGVGELRFKESDRLAATICGLRACGVEADAEGESLVVAGGRVRGGASVDSRGDHRIAMAFLILGLGAQEPVEVSDATMIATSFPGFAAAMRAIGARIDRR